jgi:hemerythrin-like metal-binding protein
MPYIFLEDGRYGGSGRTDDMRRRLKMGFNLELWKDGETTGIAIVDEDHVKIIQLYSDMVEAIDQGLGKQALLETLERLTTSVTGHFANEEAVMEKLGSINAISHKQDHLRFVRDLEDFRMNVKKTYCEDDWPAIAKYLRYRFIQHGQDYDNRLLHQRRSSGNA